MFTVYVIKSINSRFIYVGLTDNLESRLKQHNTGRGRSTKPYFPFELIYSETYEHRPEARKREKYLKSTAGKNFLHKTVATLNKP